MVLLLSGLPPFKPDMPYWHPNNQDWAPQMFWQGDLCLELYLSTLAWRKMGLLQTELQLTFPPRKIRSNACSNRQTMNQDQKVQNK
jgi:hypothetical protein